MPVTDPSFAPISASTTSTTIKIRFSKLVANDAACNNPGNYTGSAIQPASGAASPDTISGLVMWLKADAITGLADGANITTWNDSSVNGNNATYSSGGTGAPIYHTNVVNGLPAIDLGTRNTGFVTNATLSNPYTVFVVANCTTPGGNQRAVQSTTNNWLIGPYTANWSTFHGGWINGPSINNYSWNYSCLTGTASGGSFYSNGTLYGSDSSTTAPAKIAIGALGAFNEPLKGYIAEVIVYNVQLAAADIASIHTYLSNKYMPVYPAISADKTSITLTLTNGKTISPRTVYDLTVNGVNDTTGTYTISSVPLKTTVPYSGGGPSIIKRSNLTFKANGTITAHKPNTAIKAGSMHVQPTLVIQPSILRYSTCTVSNSTIQLKFDQNVVLSGPAATPQGWKISSSNGASVNVTSVSANNATVTLGVSKQTSGATYTINLPTTGINSDTHLYYSGPYAVNFTGVYSGTTTFVSSQVDANTVQISFSGPVTASDALVPNNYSIDNGVTVYGVQQLSDLVFTLQTSRLHSSTTYTVTISNIRDAAGNPI